MNDVAEPPELAPELIVVTGMSGAGRTTAANVLEDRGWYVIDNLPPQLLVAMADLLARQSVENREAVPKLAAVVDVRSREFFTDFREGLDHLRDEGWRPTVIFMDATDEALVRRFESVRRPHPLQDEGRLLDGIQREREALRDLRATADILIDTSGLNVHQLSSKVREFVGGDDGPALRIAVMSFGFKYGIPLDADHVVDMRFLANPYWITELRHLTGRDAPVRDYVLGLPGAVTFIERYVDALEPVLAGYLNEEKRYVTIAVGCTGGKHRSVAVSEAIASRLRERGHLVAVSARDLGKE